jgi:hypothetical protein
MTTKSDGIMIHPIMCDRKEHNHAYQFFKLR